MPHIMGFMVLDPESQHRLFDHLVQTPPTVAGGQVAAPDSNTWAHAPSTAPQSLVNGEYYFLAFNSPFYPSLYFCFCFNFYWSIVDLQCCVSFRYSKVNQFYIYIYPFFLKFFSHIGHYSTHLSLRTQGHPCFWVSLFSISKMLYTP